MLNQHHVPEAVEIPVSGRIDDVYNRPRAPGPDLGAAGCQNIRADMGPIAPGGISAVEKITWNAIGNNGGYPVTLGDRAESDLVRCEGDVNQLPRVILGGGEFVEFACATGAIQRPAAGLEQRLQGSLVAAAGVQQFRLADHLRIAAQPNADGDLEVAVRAVA